MRTESKAKAISMTANAAMTQRWAESGDSCLGAYSWDFNAQVRTGDVALGLYKVGGNTWKQG